MPDPLKASSPTKLQSPGSMHGTIKAPSQRKSSMQNFLDDFTSTESATRDTTPAFSSVVAFQSNSLKMQFSFTKQPDNPSTTKILSTFTNASSTPYTNFIFQAAVPKFVQLHLEPASSNVLPAAGSGSITQTLTVTNSLHGQKPLANRIRIAYKVNNQDMLEQGQINNFPPGL